MKKLILLIAVALVVGALMNNKIGKNKLILATSWLPYSADPMEYDSFIHHTAFTSVFGTLTSAGKTGEVLPLLAKRWEHDESGKNWVFEIQNKIKYSNGDLISAADYVLSLKRIAYLMKREDSHSGVMEYLSDFNSINSINDVKSIFSSGNKIHMSFSVPIKDLPYRLAFGFYALIHPSMFDNKTGEWIPSAKVISSNRYCVSKWNKEEFELRIREDLEGTEKSIHTVKFLNLNTIKNSKDLNEIDLAIAEKHSLMFDNSFDFIGGNQGFNIGYVQCYGWDKKNNLMSNLEFRKWLRLKFYNEITKNGLDIVTSFFPISLYGGVNIKRDILASKPHFKNYHLKTHTMRFGPKIAENLNKLSIQEIIDRGLKGLREGDLSVEQIEYQNSMKIEDVVDIAINGTAIDADAFEDTTKFMFVSKHGANLPDLNGKILQELKKDKINLDLINNEIWNQAIIWPILHYSSGYWISKKSSFNYDKVNFNLPALDFSFIALE